MKKPLNGIRVLELGCLEAAGIAAMLLSDFGAEVIRIDPPESAEPSGCLLTNEDSITFGTENPRAERLCDRGKKRVFLDLRDSRQRDLFDRLLPGCSLLIDGLRPNVLAGFGYTEERIRELAPSCSLIQVSGYGRSGPYADMPWSEACVQAESGFVSTTGLPGGEPVRSGGDMASFLGGVIACISSLMVLLDREKRKSSDEKDGYIGRQVDVSMMDSIVYGLENQFSLYLKSGIVPVPKGNNYALSAPVGNYMCGDGKEIMISVATEAQWKAFSEALGHPEWVEREEFLNVSRRIANYKMLGETVTEAFSHYSREELMEVLQSRACIYGCINDFPAVAEHVQSAARGMWTEAESITGEILRLPANPVLVDGMHLETHRIEAPGAQTEEILGSL